MSRIDLIPVEELTDKHLLSNYRELPRVSALAWKWYEKYMSSTTKESMWKLLRQMSGHYTMGLGHVTYLYDKGEWLRRRFEEELVPEMQRRGFKTNFTTYRMHPEGLNKDWVPDEEALRINRERIEDRLRGMKR